MTGMSTARVASDAAEVGATAGGSRRRGRTRNDGEWKVRAELG